MRTMAAELIKDESGVAAIEYGLIAALIAVVTLGAVSLLGSTLSSLFSGIASSL